MKLADLQKPFPMAAIHWRVQGKPYQRNGNHFAMALAYIDARDVMDRFDEVCGPENWQSEFSETSSGRVICRIGVRCGDQWVWKSDGAGGTAVEGEKGGISDALKRAAVAWGVGRYLYRIEAPWVACEVNDKGGWRRWTEDPWTKVKNAAAINEVAPADFDHRAEADRIIAAIKKSGSKAEMSAAYKANQGAIERIEAEKPPMFGEIKKAVAEVRQRFSQAETSDDFVANFGNEDAA